MTRGEIDRIARHELVIRLADVVLRRTTLAISGALTLANLVGLAKVCAQALGWTKERRDAEVAVTLVRINRVRLARWPARYWPASSRLTASTLLADDPWGSKCEAK